MEVFDYAFKNGLDLILVGMFFFQIIQDAIFAREARGIKSGKGRGRHGTEAKNLINSVGILERSFVQ